MKVNCPNCWREFPFDPDFLTDGHPGLCNYCGGFFLKSRRKNIRLLTGPERVRLELWGIADQLRSIRRKFVSSLHVNQHRRKDS